MTTTPPSFTCPRCGAVSHNSGDAAEGYCGRCHDWTSAEVAARRKTSLTDEQVAMARAAVRAWPPWGPEQREAIRRALAPDGASGAVTVNGWTFDPAREIWWAWAGGSTWREVPGALDSPPQVRPESI